MITEENALEFINSFSNYFTFSKYNSQLAMLHIHKDIAIDTHTLSAGEYFLGYVDDEEDLVIFREIQQPQQTSLFDDDAKTLEMVLSPIDNKPINLIRLTYYIGEYNEFPVRANQMLDTFFPQAAASVSNPILSALQEFSFPSTFVYPKDKVTQNLFSNSFTPEEQYDVKSGKDITTTENGKRIKKPLAPRVTLSLSELPSGVKINRELTEYDNNVFRAICSIWSEGNNIFTGHEIHKVMTGNRDAKATEATLEAINESWTRLTTTFIELDTGTMGEAYKFDRWTRREHIIVGGSSFYVTQNQHENKENIYYRVSNSPLLLDYANTIDQIARFPIKELCTPINKNHELLTLQMALLERIHSIPNLSNHIIYDTLFECIDFGDSSEQQKARKIRHLRGYIHTMLDYWVNIGVISSWREEKKGKSITKLIVNLPRKALPSASGQG